MRRILALILSVLMLVSCFPAGAITLETVESTEETAAVVEVTAEAAEEAELAATFTATPGLNVVNNRAEIENFDGISDVSEINVSTVTTGSDGVNPAHDVRLNPLASDGNTTDKILFVNGKCDYNDTSHDSYPQIRVSATVEAGRKYYTKLKIFESVPTAKCLWLMNGGAAWANSGISNYDSTVVKGEWFTFSNTVIAPNNMTNFAYQVKVIGVKNDAGEYIDTYAPFYVDELAFVPYYKINYVGADTDYVLFADENDKDLTKLMTAYTPKTDNYPVWTEDETVAKKCVGWSLTEGGEAVTSVPLANADITLYPVWEEVDFVSCETPRASGGTGTTVVLTATEAATWTLDAGNTGATGVASEDGLTYTVTAGGYAGAVTVKAVMQSDEKVSVTNTVTFVGGDKIRPGVNIWTGTENAYTFDGEEASLEGFLIGSEAATGGLYPATVATKAKDEDTDNKALKLSMTFQYIATEAFPVLEKERPIRVVIDYLYQGQIRILANDTFPAGMYSKADGIFQYADIAVILAENTTVWATKTFTGLKGAQTHCDPLNESTHDYFKEPYSGSAIENLFIYEWTTKNAETGTNSPSYIDNVSMIPYYKVTYSGTDSYEYVAPTETSYTIKSDNYPEWTGETGYYNCIGWSTTEGATEPMETVELGIEDIKLFPVWDSSYVEGTTQVSGGTGTTAVLTAKEAGNWTVDVGNTGATYTVSEDGTVLTITAGGYAGAVSVSAVSKTNETVNDEVTVRFVGGDKLRPGLNILTGTKNVYTFDGEEANLAGFTTNGTAAIVVKGTTANAENNAIAFPAQLDGITVASFPETDIDRPFKYNTDLWFTGQIRVAAVPALSEAMLNKADIHVSYNYSAAWASTGTEIKTTRSVIQRPTSVQNWDGWAAPYSEQTSITKLWIYAYSTTAAMNSNGGPSYVDNISFIPYYKVTYTGASYEYVSPDAESYTVKSDNYPTWDGTGYYECIGWSLKENGTADDIVTGSIALEYKDIVLYPVWKNVFIESTATQISGATGNTVTVTAKEAADWTVDTANSGATYTVSEDGMTLTITANGTAGKVSVTAAAKSNAEVTMGVNVNIVGGEKLRPGLNIWTGTTAGYTFDGDEASLDGFIIGAEKLTGGVAYPAIDVRNTNAGVSNNALRFTRELSHIAAAAFPLVDKDRPLKVDYDFIYTGQIRVLANDAFDSTMYNKNSTSGAWLNGDIIVHYEGGATTKWNHKTYEIYGSQSGTKGSGTCSVYYNAPYSGSDIENIYFYEWSDLYPTEEYPGYRGANSKGNYHNPTYMDNISIIPYYKLTYVDVDGTTTVEYKLVDSVTPTFASGATKYIVNDGTSIHTGAYTLTNEDVVFTAVPDLEMNKTVTSRIDKNGDEVTGGIRFKASIANADKENEDITEYGFIVAREKHLTKLNAELTHEFMHPTATETPLYATGVNFNRATGVDKVFDKDDTHCYFTGVCVNIPTDKAADVKENIVARPYIVMKKGDETIYLYGNTNKYSLGQAMLDVQTAGGTDYTDNQTYVDDIVDLYNS